MAQPSGLDKVTAFFKGLGGVADAVGDIVDTGADMAEDVARGRDAIHTEQLKRAEWANDIALSRLTTTRGDNVQIYWAMAFVGVLAVVLISR